MPTKAQARASIDAAGTLAKNEIDNTLPVGVNIVDGRINFNPTTLTFQMDAGGSLATATSWRDTIQTNLTSQSRTFTTRSTLGRRTRPDADGTHEIFISTTLTNFQITNF